MAKKFNILGAWSHYSDQATATSGKVHAVDYNKVNVGFGLFRHQKAALSADSQRRENSQETSFLFGLVRKYEDNTNGMKRQGMAVKMLGIPLWGKHTEIVKAGADYMKNTTSRVFFRKPRYDDMWKHNDVEQSGMMPQDVREKLDKKLHGTRSLFGEKMDDDLTAKRSGGEVNADRNNRGKRLANTRQNHEDAVNGPNLKDAHVSTITTGSLVELYKAGVEHFITNMQFKQLSDRKTRKTAQRIGVGLALASTVMPMLMPVGVGLAVAAAGIFVYNKYKDMSNMKKAVALVEAKNAMVKAAQGYEGQVIDILDERKNTRTALQDEAAEFAQAHALADTSDLLNKVSDVNSIMDSQQSGRTTENQIELAGVAGLATYMGISLGTGPGGVVAGLGALHAGARYQHDAADAARRQEVLDMFSQAKTTILAGGLEVGKSVGPGIVSGPSPGKKR